jgi:hypothetical protein
MTNSTAFKSLFGAAESRAARVAARVGGRVFVRRSLTPGVAAVSPRGVALSASCLLVFCLIALARPGAASGQSGVRAAKLPGPDRVVADYLKAVGGKKRVQSIRDETYEWEAEGDADARLRTFVKAPAAVRSDYTSGGRELNVSANARTAWVRAADGSLSTLTGEEANAAKLDAALAASRLADYKKQDVLARTVGVEPSGAEQAYVVEFSRRNGARVRYWFGATSKLLLKVAGGPSGRTQTLEDYRPTPSGLLVAHRGRVTAPDGTAAVYLLRGVRFNAGLSDTLFEPPGDASLNVVELLREVARNQRELDERVGSYTFTRTQTEREINDRGEVKKEKTQVHEVYPVAGGGRVLKLVAEDGRPLPPEKLAREERRAVEEIEKLERESERRKQKREAEAARRKAGETGAGEDGDSDVGIGVFLRACEFFSPRRERFRDRDVIVFDFRPRPGFKPANRGESVVGKLTGAVWIDPADRQVMRLEARLTEGFKIGGGLLASVRPGSAFAFEQTRLPDGVWLPKFSQINAAAKVFLFAGLRIDATREYSNYKRFDSKSGDAALDSPKPPPQN